jgi:hypothetical protein
MSIAAYPQISPRLSPRVLFLEVYIAIEKYNFAKSVQVIVHTLYFEVMMNDESLMRQNRGCHSR